MEDNKYKEYLKKYAIKHQVTIDEAATHSMCITVEKSYIDSKQHGKSYKNL